MATPMTPSQIKAQLHKWGVKYREYRSWSTHNRNHKGAWGPVNGFMVHHTGSDSKDQRALLYNGTADLPGPLCHFGLAQDGTVWLIGWGRANHAGSGDPDVLRAVINESYGNYPPRDKQSTVDGNSRFYGVEIWYSGSHKMTDAQYASLRKLAAAVIDFHGWSEKSVIGHGEWGSPGKWDPGYAPGKMMDMAVVRRDIRATLKGGKPASTPASKPAVDLSSLIAAAKRDPGLPQGGTTHPKDVKPVEAALRAEGLLPAKYASDGSFGSLTVKAYAAWQRKCGYRGKDADGIPGKASLTKLGAKHGFTVKA